MVALNRQFQHKSITTPSSGGSMATPTTLPNVDAQESWNLDGMGNWRSLTYTAMGDTPSVQQRSHNRLNQITNLGGRAFTYDGSPGASNGNLADDSFRAYQFDALNRQIQVNSAGSGTVLGSYVFDAFNRRIRKTISNGGFGGGIANGTTDYIHLGNQVMEERNPFGGTGSTDTPIRQYIWGTYIDEQIQLTTLTALGAQNVPAGTYYLLQDLLYRAVALTNSSGAIVEAYDTDAYGQTIIYTGPGADGVWFTDDDAGSGLTYGANDIIFCGYRYDPETRLYYVRNRMFLTDAEGISVGRWLQRDPIGYRSGFNLYEYVYDSPTRYIDPSGLQSPGFALAEAIAEGDVAEVETILDASEDVLTKDQIAAAREFLAKDARCVAVHAAYKAAGANCRSCNTCTTRAQAEANAACFTAEIAGRTLYLKLGCDYVLAGSIARGSAAAAAGHRAQLAAKAAALAKCVAKALSLPG